VKSAAETNLFSPFESDILLGLKLKASSTFRDLPWPQRIVLCGGAFASWFHDEEPKDIDLFILWDKDNAEGGHSEVLDTYRGAFPWLEQQPSKYREDINPNITDVWGADKHTKSGKIQLIFTKYKTRKELVDHFDYAHAMVSYACINGPGDPRRALDLRMFISRQTYECIRDKKLVINNKDNWRQYRESKFVQRGWTVADKDRLVEIEKEIEKDKSESPW
jgi:hypothetical protein